MEPLQATWAERAYAHHNFNQKLESFMSIRSTSDRTVPDLVGSPAKALPEGSAASNRQALNEALLSKVPLKKEANRYLPIHRLPPEILISVFHLDLHLPIYSIDAETVLKTNVSRIVKLSSVCSRWRSLVVGTRSLWTRVRIPLHYSPVLVAMCVDRARGGPLNIIAIEPDEKQEWKNWEGEGALRDFTKNVRSLSVTAHTSGPINWASDWMSNLDHPLRLEELSVALPYKSPWSFDAPESLNLSTVASSLHTLHLQNVDANWSECTFDRLRVLKLNNINTLKLSRLRPILATSPMLQVLEFRSNNIALHLCGFRSTPEPITLPILKTLRLYCRDLFQAERALQVFKPGTYNVEIYSDGICEYSLKRLGGYVSCATGSNINTLGFCRPTAELGLVLACITNTLPNLATLCLKNVELRLGNLAAIEQTIEKLPNLKTIRIAHARVTNVASFKDTLQRCSGRPRIELVDSRAIDTGHHLSYPIKPGAPLYEWILARGLNVSFLPK
ncbi:hypothetical protein RSOLAG1IB_01129 [Rhizoctonia solani AG-1 IB]|uniref:F-box domain-containing protein n=1 Tax=Thanatephorus cucumeris (strain AG1-IB / isolate 7/3/14) TaxID=1108050 RepID=A0A0B7FAQ1_THACB|nr:hypothetical protein RSOLAG1IB_01129 [Rhizoctonia solani AG-1 IB]